MERRFVKVASIDDIPPGLGKMVMAHGKPMALFNVDGEFCAINQICPPWEDRFLRETSMAEWSNARGINGRIMSTRVCQTMKEDTLLLHMR